MARSTSHIFNPEIRGARANRNTIVTRSDPRIQDGDSGRCLNVNAIGVGAIPGSRDFHSLHFDVLTGIDDNVEHLAI